MSVRVKFVLVSMLLLLAVGSTVIAAVATVQAIQGFQQQRSLLHSGDVRSVSDWMTIPYIASTYHVPADYLYQWLHITDKQKPGHATLRLLAARFHQPVKRVIQSVQAAIQAYRAQHLSAKTSGSTGANAIRIRRKTRFMMEDDGRPQGVQPPVSTIRRCWICPYIVGTGAVWTGSWAPCGRPPSFRVRGSRFITGGKFL